MKTCPKCNTQLDDSALFCTTCGTQFGNTQPQDAVPPQQNAVPPQGVYAAAPAYDPYDHTAEFDPKDISDNKVISMLVYLMGAIGIIYALLAGKDSKYVAFHVRQALKFEVVIILLTIVMALLFWTLIVPIVGGVCLAIVLVLKVICFFQICSGKAKEPAIIRSLGFLK